MSDIPIEQITHALELLPIKMNSTEAKVLLVAIGLQESRFKHRKQIKGPAHGYWQFESGGGVRGVMTHHSSRSNARLLCAQRGVNWNQSEIYEAIVNDDVLAAGFARLLLWTDANAIPEIGESDLAWDYYIRNWRPGKPHPETWSALYQQAVGVVV
jgi:hypothetical protein